MCHFMHHLCEESLLEIQKMCSSLMLRFHICDRLSKKTFVLVCKFLRYLKSHITLKWLPKTLQIIVNLFKIIIVIGPVKTRHICTNYTCLGNGTFRDHYL